MMTMMITAATAPSQAEPAAAQPQQSAGASEENGFQRMLDKAGKSQPAERPKAEGAKGKRPTSADGESMRKLTDDELPEEEQVVLGGAMLLNITRLNFAEVPQDEELALPLVTDAPIPVMMDTPTDIMPDLFTPEALESAGDTADAIADLLKEMELVTDEDEVQALLAELEPQLLNEPDTAKVTDSIERFLSGVHHDGKPKRMDKGQETDKAQEGLPLEAHDKIGALMRAHTDTLRSVQSGAQAGLDGQDDLAGEAEAQLTAASNDGEGAAASAVHIPFAQALESLNQQAVTAAPQGEAPVEITPKFIFDQIVEQATFSAKDSAQEIDIIIRPEFLGRMAIRLAMDGDKLTAQIRTANSNVHSILASELSTLAQTLREKGIEIAEMTVVYDNHTREDLSENNARQGQHQDGSKRRRAAVSFSESIYSSSSYEELLMGILPGMEQGGVEYKV